MQLDKAYNKFTLNGKGYIILHQVFSYYTYFDGFTYVRDNFLGRLIKRLFNFIERNIPWVSNYDRNSLDLVEGRLWPMYSGSYWLTLPYRLTNRYAKRIDGWTLGELQQ